MIPASTRFTLWRNDIKKYFGEFKGSTQGNKGMYYKNLCTITFKGWERYEMTRFSPEGKIFTKIFDQPISIIQFIEHLKSMGVPYKIKNIGK